MKHLEIEMKTLLSKEEYDRLLAQFSEVTPVTQKNYYLDTPDFYLRHHKNCYAHSYFRYKRRTDY